MVFWLPPYGLACSESNFDLFVAGGIRNPFSRMLSARLPQDASDQDVEND